MTKKLEHDKLTKKNTSQRNELLRSLPSVDEVLKSEKAKNWCANYPQRIVVNAIRDSVALMRKTILEGDISAFTQDEIAVETERLLKERTAYSLKPVINATGVIVHTNLGRSALSEVAINHMVMVAKGYSNLEYNLARGERGKRYSHVVSILCELTGAEAGFVVNNNAAAVLITLNTLARGKEVIVSRGELIEIGGSFRMPDVMAASGAILKEVGTTNKTHLADYERAISESSALILKVHTSNYRIVGFTKDVAIEGLVQSGQAAGLPVVFDLGSGCLIDLKRYGIGDEPSVQDVVRKGVDLVTFSGDKLLGGPQAGMIVGRQALVERIQKNPIARAVRIDKLTLAALEATLMSYLDEEKALTQVPTLCMLLQPLLTIEERALALAQRFMESAKSDTLEVGVKKDTSQAGGGSLPAVELPTFIVTLTVKGVSVNTFAQLLREAAPYAVVTRIKEDKLCFDARTIADSEIETIAAVVERILVTL